VEFVNEAAQTQQAKTVAGKRANPAGPMDFPSRTIPAQPAQSRKFPALCRGFRNAKSFSFNRSGVRFLLGVQEVPGSNPGSPTNPFNSLQRRPNFKLGLCDASCDVTTNFGFACVSTKAKGLPCSCANSTELPTSPKIMRAWASRDQDQISLRDYGHDRVGDSR